jgi:putative methyltransferase (TIGR04325 family)
LRKLIIWYLQLRTLWKPYGYFGNYSSWAEALTGSLSYDSDSIILKVFNASVAVRDGKATYERDGIAFFNEFQWDAIPYIEALASENKNHLKVLDFGGALGSHYYPIIKRLPGIKFDWTIVEQKAFVDIGNKEFASANLQFESSLTKALSQGTYNLILLGCVLPYVSNPEEVLAEITRATPEAILIDKHPVIAGDKNRLTVQRINPTIYEASYPAWFFSEKRFLKFFKDYDLADSYDCPDIFNIDSVFKTYFFRLKR